MPFSIYLSPNQLQSFIGFYQAIMRPRWTDLERRRSDEVWKQSQERFVGNVIGPHYEELCRTFVRDFASHEVLGGIPSDVGHGVVNDAAHRTSLDIDVVVLSESDAGKQKILSLGDVKWGRVMGVSHVQRLTRARELLSSAGWDVSQTMLACYSGAGFTDDLRATAQRDGSLLVGLDELYREPAREAPQH